MYSFSELIKLSLGPTIWYNFGGEPLSLLGHTKTEVYNFCEVESDLFTIVRLLSAIRCHCAVNGDITILQYDFFSF